MNYTNDSLLREKRTEPLITAAIILGIGIAGITDGILFKQLLQWHPLLSATVSPYSDTNTHYFWNGIYQGFFWMLTATGILLLWCLVGRNDISRSNRVFFGSMLLGCGIFILLEGIINHYLLSLHHVNETSAFKKWWDIGFLLFGALVTATGWMAIFEKQQVKERKIIKHQPTIYPVQYIKSKAH